MIIAIVIWGIGRIGALPEVMIVLSQVLGAIGIVLLAIGLILHFSQPPVGTPGDQPRDSSMTVTVYSKPACPQCTATVRTLEKLRIDHPDLEIVKIDVTEDAKAFDVVVSLGYGSAPVVVAGDEHWSGYRPDRLNALVA